MFYRIITGFIWTVMALVLWYGLGWAWTIMRDQFVNFIQVNYPSAWDAFASSLVTQVDAFIGNWFFAVALAIFIYFLVSAQKREPDTYWR